MLAVYKKELRSFFINPVGFVFTGIFLTLAAFLCCFTTLSLIVLIPLLTMRSFAEERKMRTEQMLLTAPVTITGLVLGKYLASFTIFAGCMLVSCFDFVPLYIVGKAEAALNKDSITHIGPVTSQIAASVLGVLLIGAAFIAIGIFVSSLTENQLSSAIITIAVLWAVSLGLVLFYVFYLKDFLSAHNIKIG